MTEEKNIIEKNNSIKKSKTKPTKLKKTIRFFLGVVIILAIGYGVLNYVPFIAKYDHYVIATGSMDPVISIRDVVIIDSSTTIEDLEIGDIIAFNVDINNDGVDDVVVHYLYSIEEVDGEIVIRTKPEISDQIDEWELSVDDIIGKHVGTIRKLGGFLLFASSTFGKVILLVDVVAIYVIIEFLFVPKKEEITKSNDTEKKENVEGAEE